MSRLAALLSLFLSFPLSSFLLVSTWQWRPSEAFRPLSLTKKDSFHYAAAVGSNERYSLDLCDCEAAVGPPGGLSCSKEGFFVADFERQGQWVAGGGTVPLSRAICCRPCLPRELADALSEESATRTSGVARHLASKRRVGDDAVAQMVSSIVKVSARALPPGLVTALASGSRPVSVVSLGCHGSTDALPLRCEATADSFVTGFVQGVKVFSTPALYPIDMAQCCTPALLMDDGSAWELERCGCHSVEDSDHSVNCNGNSTGELLAGFDYFRMSPIGQIVPIGPAKCCGICVTDPRNSSSQPHSRADCSELSHCSNHGVCILGRCECRPGWGGADCAYPLGGRGRGDRIPPWGIAAIVIGACVLAIMLLILVGNVAEALYESDGGDTGEGTRRPLLEGIDEDDLGSVGSQDTEDETLEDVEERIEGFIRRLDRDEEDNAQETDGLHRNHEGSEQQTGAREDSSPNGHRGIETPHQHRGEAPDAHATESPTELGRAQREGSDNDAHESSESSTTVMHNEGDAAARPVPSSHGESFNHGSPSSEPARPPGLASIVDDAPDRQEQHPFQWRTTVENGDQNGSPGDRNGENEETSEPQDEGVPQKPPRGSMLDSYAGVGPLANVDCSVCMIRPVQTVLVPCGHVCMCRRCSRRLQRCPMCRTSILRRQRLFV